MMQSDFHDSCEPDFSKEQCVRIGRLRGPCSAKRSVETEEGTGWRQTSRSDQRSHINARPHVSGAVSEILEKYGRRVLPHPRYSPDMSPPAFDLFPKLKKPLRGKRFRSIEEVSNEVTRVIRRINIEGVLTGIQDLSKRLTAVINYNGDYTEGL
jgi:transposase